MAVAALRLFLFLNPTPPAEDIRPHEELGRTLATEAMQLAGPTGRLIVIGREISEFKVPAAAAQLSAFQDAVKKAGKSVASVRLAKIDPLRTLAMPPAELYDVVRQAKEEDVIVSFLGPALLPADQAAKLGPKHAKVLAVCPAGMASRIDLAAIFAQDVLVTAIVARPDAPAALAAGDARNAFEQAFKKINRGNLAELAALLPAREEGVR